MSRSRPTPKIYAALGICLGGLTFVLAACADGLLDPGSLQEAAAESVLEMSQDHYQEAATTRARRRWLRRVRRATRDFRRLSVAQESGYDVQATPCQETDAGGMGYHFANFGLLDDKLEETRPEILLYEPRPGGREKLVAVEYAIPYAFAPRDGEPPELHGVAFNQNDVFDLWVLHAWAWKKNPAGTFEGWNPRVSCRFDDQEAH